MYEIFMGVFMVYNKYVAHLFRTRNTYIRNEKITLLFSQIIFVTNPMVTIKNKMEYT